MLPTPARHPTLLVSTLLCASLLGCAGAPAVNRAALAGPPPPAAAAWPAAPPASGDGAPPPRSAEAAPVILSGPAPAAPSDDRPGLATAWGETTWSPSTTTPFVRDGASPWATAVLHYNDADGVRAHAAHLGQPLRALEAWASPGDVAVALIDDAGAALPGFVAADRYLVAAVDGGRYRIAISNHTPARFEVVASVDGLDVIDGRPAGLDRRGYVVEPGSQLVIDGFRQSGDQVAAFRFGAVAASYAARSSGDTNVGVVGVALFAERGARWTPAELERRDRADPFPVERERAYSLAPH
ncbi:MAG: hypothetical protein R3B06_19860 [Kofleriaceae bacterium]